MFAPSVFQSAIFNDIAEGSGNSIINAVAGSGKTTTLVKGFDYLPSGLSTLFVAFNKAIAEELSARIPQNKGINCSTLHSFGFKACFNAYGRVKMDKYKVNNLCKDFFPNLPKEAYWPMQKAVSICKAYITTQEEINSEYILEIITKHDISYSVEEYSFGEFIADIAKILNLCKNQTNVVDFDDMVWIPCINNIRLPKFDRVFVDEAQDLNLVQLELVCRAVKPSGRITVVGDDRQGIYGFRGAASGAMTIMRERLEAKDFPLSITYRCPKSVVRLASKYVPDFTASETAIEGSVTNQSISDMVKNAIAGDLIVSRTNAPLARLAYKFIAMEKRARIRGKDFGDQLVSIAKKYQKDCAKGHTTTSMQGFLSWILLWEDNQVNIIKGKYESWEKIAETVNDKADCIRVIASKCQSVSEVIASIETLFSDLNDSNSITLSTTHKAKGLEYKNVFCLETTYGRKDTSLEEENLYYVAITRAKENLILVCGDIKSDNDIVD